MRRSFVLLVLLIASATALFMLVRGGEPRDLPIVPAGARQVPRETKPPESLSPLSSEESDPQVSAAREPARAVAGDDVLRTVSITVTGLDGAPLSAAHVQVFVGTQSMLRVTDERGRCALPVAEAIDALILLVERDGYAHARAKRGCRTPITIALAPAASLGGRVLERGTGLPIAGAAVERRHDSCLRCDPDLVLTDEQGGYVLSGVPCGEKPPLSFSVRAAGYRGMEQEFVLREQGPSFTHDFELGRAELAGQVVDFTTGAPVTDATVRVGIDVLGTDDRGRFTAATPTRLDRATERRTSPEQIVVRAPGYVRITIPLEGLERPLLVRLPRGGVVAGRVLDPAGHPIAGATVALLNGNWSSAAREGTSLADLPASWGLSNSTDGVASDREGRYRLDGVLPWSKKNELRVNAKDLQPTDLELAELEPGRELELDLQLEPFVQPGGVTIFGQLTLNGQPSPGTVSWMCGNEGRSTKVEQGEYRLENVPAKTITLSAHPRNQSIVDFVPEAQVELTLGPARELRHDFHLELPLGSISGHVRFEDGTPASRLEVRARAESSNWIGTTATGAEGAYRLVVPDHGLTFELSTSLATVKRVRSAIVAGATNVDFVLPTMGHVLFRALDRTTHEPVAPFWLSWRPASRGDFEGLVHEQQDAQGFFWATIPAGSVDLYLNASLAGYQGSSRENVRVAAEGEAERITFELEPGITLNLALDPPQHPPPEAVVALPSAELWGDLAWERDAAGHNRLCCGGRSSGNAISVLSFDDSGRCTVKGVAPGRYRLKAFLDPLVFEPDEILVTGELHAPIPIRWRMK